MSQDSSTDTKKKKKELDEYLKYDDWVVTEGCEYCREHLEDHPWCGLCKERWLKETNLFKTILDNFPEETETIFLVFKRHPVEEDIFCRAFYTHEKAQSYCDDMNRIVRYGTYIVREEEIK